MKYEHGTATPSRKGSFAWGVALAISVAACGTPVMDTDSGTGDSAVSDAGGDASTTMLPIDCRIDGRRPTTEMDPRCSPNSDGTVGSGPAFGAQFGEGFLDGGHIIFTAGPPLGDAWAVYSLDPATGVRTVVSGTYQDPRLGMMTVGTGPTIRHVYDAAKGPDGAYYFFATVSTHMTSTWGSSLIDDSVILRVDPATGNRTEVLDFAQMSTACMTTGGTRLYPNDVLVVGGDNQDYLTFDIASDGAFYVSVGRDMGGSRKWGGVARFRGGQCHIVSLFDTMGTDNVGTGIELPTGAPAVIRLAGDHLYAVPASVYSIVQIDIATGNRMLISTADTHVAAVGTGPGIHPDYMFVGADGSIWTSGGGDITMSSLTRVDPATGNRTGYSPATYVHCGRNAHELYGVDATRPFAYFSDHNPTIGVLEYTTGNHNILME